MKRSRFENRARWLSQNYRTKKGEQEVLPPSMSAKQYWAEHVKTETDVVTYYSLYHPELPDALVKALAKYLTRAVDGELVLEKHWYSPDAVDKLGIERPPEQHIPWDFEKEIEEEKELALVAVAEEEEATLWKAEDIPSDVATVNDEQNQSVMDSVVDQMMEEVLQE